MFHVLDDNMGSSAHLELGPSFHSRVMFTLNIICTPVSFGRLKSINLVADSAQTRRASKDMMPWDPTRVRWKLCVTSQNFGKEVVTFSYKHTPENRSNIHARMFHPQRARNGKVNLRSYTVANAPLSLAVIARVDTLRRDEHSDPVLKILEQIPIASSEHGRDGLHWARLALEALQKAGHIRPTDLSSIIDIAA